MKFIPIACVTRFKANIQSKIADAIAALRVAEAKLEQAADEHEATSGSLEAEDLFATQFNARIFAGLLEAIVTGKPTLAPRVFRTLANHVNEEPHNTPHVEGAILALTLAERSLEQALDMAKQLDGDAIDEAYQLPFAAMRTVSSMACLLRSGVLGCFEEARTLDMIIAGKRRVALSA